MERATRWKHAFSGKLMSRHVDSEVLAQLEQLMGADFSRLIATYLRDASASFAQMQNARAAADVEGLRRSAHSLKGGALNIGAVALAELCAEVENAARDGELSRIAALLVNVADELQGVQSALHDRRVAH